MPQSLKHYRLQSYSIRDLFAIVTISALLASIFATWHNEQLQRRERERLQHKQDLFWEHCGFSAYRGDDYQVDTIIAFDLPSNRYSITDLKLPDTVKRIVIRRGQFNDECAVGLDSLPNLELLVLSDTLITDDAMQVISNCKRLRFLNITNTAVSDASIDLIATMDRLEAVYIEGTSISEAGAKRLRTNQKGQNTLMNGNGSKGSGLVGE